MIGVRVANWSCHALSLPPSCLDLKKYLDLYLSDVVIGTERRTSIPK